MRSFEFAEYFDKRIKELGLSRCEIAEQTGVSRQMLYNLTKGLTGEAKISNVVAIARVLKVHPVYLFRLLLSQTEFPKYISVTRYKGDATGFIADVTISDNSSVLVNQVFIKTWEIQNIGHVDWVGRQLLCVDKPVDHLPAGSFVAPNTQRGLMPTQRMIAIPETLSGQTVRLSVEFTAPPYPCSVLSYWKMVDAQGEFCFPQSEGLSCQVQVVAL